ncbi:threonyl-tRNA synthetase [Verrucomicrobium sp. GAS474]|uniref:threonine--tRNA ligase n=1 Tax=Verrucomicrobium sp. GAS474 TaxID=1882831 RepID=UPI00087B9F41|nr:threonine--tRNA ligase [Verrucomicrobium sp. GAS474]SDU30101.1 threonyl-tRNA synthetase [Verrucomicrobium sp. GAS474]
MNELETIRHSAAHVLATALLEIWPDAQFAAGPPVEQGFYYDVDLKHRVSPEDFPKIEEVVSRILKERQPFVREVISRADAQAMAERGELAALGPRPTPSVFKLDILKGIPEGETITLFRNAAFTDLCAGPHVPDTGGIGAFKLTHVASAYYKGDEKNPQLQRIYGTAFATQAEMDAHFAMIEEAKKRDHRKLGKELQLFTFDEDIGPGLPLWLPKGTVLIEELEKLAKETEFAANYQRVRTPHIAREKLYKTSGHLPYYAESMFPPMEMKEDESDKEPVTYYLKAMNCPHHHKLFAALPRSYRDLPLRFAEYGTCYRYEQSGELFGLMRVRAMQMNDAHIYCTAEQFAAEFQAVNEMYLKYFKIFGIEKYRMRFSTHDPEKLGQKYVDEPELWKKTEDMVRKVLIETGINYIEVPNEGAFYGPKIDVQVWSAIGREFTLATNQVDFAVPARFGLEFTTSANTKETPLCIHRAPLGTHERFIGFLIEHFAGDFPLWLAPEQVRILPVNPELNGEAESLCAELRAKGIRAAVDGSPDRLGAKIRLAQVEKTPYMVVLGKNEVANRQLSVRSRKHGDLGVIDRSAFFTRIESEISERAL